MNDYKNIDYLKNCDFSHIKNLGKVPNIAKHIKSVQPMGDREFKIRMFYYRCRNWLQGRGFKNTFYIAGYKRDERD